MDSDDIEARIDPRRALADLGYAVVSEPERVLGGWETLLWRFSSPDNCQHSLRVYQLPGLPEDARREVARRERIALDACEKAGLPAPRVETAGEVQGLPAMVLSWCPGMPLLSVIEKRPWSMWRLGRLFGRTQARLHAVAPPAELVATAPDDWTSRVGEKHGALTAHVLSLPPSIDTLIHMDFHPLNLITNGSEVTGIIDWAGAAAGDRRADLARTVATLLAAPVPPGPLRPALNLARKLVTRAWRSGYEEAAGHMPDYTPFLAWAGATLLLEMERDIGGANVWETEQDIERFRHLIDVWAREAGIH
jgi:aminoglycoside phosphotransferase (APT) family kinase protein